MCVADDCCGKCFRSLARALLIIVNVIFVLAGLLMLGLGIALVVAPTKVLAFLKVNTASISEVSELTGGSLNSLIKAVGIFMIILGGVVVIIGTFGFFGASCDNKCMLVTYAVILIIIVLAETALIIFAAVYPSTFTNVGKSAVQGSFNDFNQDLLVDSSGNINYTVGDNAEGWGVIQLALGCCGVNNYTDYKKTPPTWQHCGTAACANSIVPISCCELKDPSALPATINDFVNYQTCQSPTPDPTVINQQGCVDLLVDDSVNLIKQNSKIAIGIAAGIIGLEVILIVLAFVVCCMETEGGKYV
jgi:hypothetical protein